MAKTTVTATRSLADIVEEFASISDSSSLRYHQARLAYEYIGSTEGKEAAELKDVFRKEANTALRRHNEAELSVPGVTNLVNTWKYLTRANVDTNVETNPAIFPIAKAAFNLASQSFREKEKNYVNPAIEAILNGMDPVKAFVDQTALLKKDKKADAEEKEGRRREKENDPEVVFDSISAMLKMITPDNFKRLTAEHKSTIRELIAAASAVVSA